MLRIHVRLVDEMTRIERVLGSESLTCSGLRFLEKTWPGCYPFAKSINRPTIPIILQRSLSSPNPQSTQRLRFEYSLSSTFGKH